MAFINTQNMVQDQDREFRLLIQRLSNTKALFVLILIFSTVVWILTSYNFSILYGFIMFLYTFLLFSEYRYHISKSIASFYNKNIRFGESIKENGYIYKIIIFSVIISFYRALIDVLHLIYITLDFIPLYIFVIIFNIVLLSILFMYRKLKYRSTMYDKKTIPAPAEYLEIGKLLEKKFGVNGVIIRILKHNRLDLYNAFALKINRNLSFVVFTRDFSGALTMDDITGIMAHEIAHIKNNDAYKFFTVYSMPIFLIFDIIFVTYILIPYYLFLAELVDIILIISLTTRIPPVLYRRHIEKMADIAVAKNGYGEYLISGIEKLNSLNRFPAKKIKQVIFTHYSTDERRNIIEKYAK